MPKKILFIYYTQTGQLREIVDSVAAPFKAEPDISLVFEEIKPKPLFPFPWTSDGFFQAMPESVTGIPCELEPLNIREDDNFDLIVMAWQPWYLSPSIPAHAIFQNEVVRRIINGKPVITIIGSRNMWVMAHEKVKQYIQAANGILSGNIMLYDKAPNLLSVVSVIRWMFQGKKERYMKIIPPAGVTDRDIADASRFGRLILQAVKSGTYNNLRSELVNAGAVEVKPELVMIEKRGIIFFRLWASFILKKGSYGAPSRLARVRMFKYYLLTVIYLASPFATALYYLSKPFRRKAIQKQISLYQT
jgi:hypothetical protein